MSVERIEDRAAIQSMLLQDRAGAVYLLGYLDEVYTPWCSWWGAYEDGEEVPRALLLLYDGLSVPVAITAGDPAHVGPLVKEVYSDLPDRFYCHLREEHLDSFREFFDLTGLKETVRMSLVRDRYEAQSSDVSVVRLGHRDTAAIVKLYDHYPDNLFEPYQLESGLYFGIQEAGGGQLVSIAGIHVVSDVNDVAVVGNVVTHPEYRKSKLASLVMTRLLDELFDRVSLVAVNVSVDNVPARKTMEGFAFELDHNYWEGMAKLSY
jgi:ribosomal protein S18 acetylase RimI-like enzyme